DTLALHDALPISGAHSAQRGRETGDGVLRAFGAQLCHERWSSPLEAREQRQAAPVVDERFDAVLLDALGKRLVAELPALSCLWLEARMGADREQREQ